MFLYKAAAHIICEPLSFLFNLSIKESTVPTTWKHAVVTPIPKLKCCTLQDLRPISLLPIPIKVLETIVLTHLKDDLVRAYGPDQFGFRPKSSTACALISLHDYCMKCFDDPRVSGIQITAYDFSKAFDRLKYEIILKRLLESHIPISITKWIKSYLEDRTQCVKIGTAESEVAAVLSGVPQGSVLAPYLFSLVTGSFDISHIPSRVIKYADDFTICVPLFRDCENEHVLSAHNALVSWSEENSLPLNVNKCKVLAIPRISDFTPVNLPAISFVDELRLLGVTFDANYNWSKHIDRIIRSASRNLFIVRNLKNVFDTQTLIDVFNSIVRSLLEYCSPLFIGLSNENSVRLQRIQTRFHKYLCGPECCSHILEPLSKRREAAAVKLFIQAKAQDHVLHCMLPPISRSGRVILPPVSHQRRLRSFIFKTAQLINALHVR